MTKQEYEKPTKYWCDYCKKHKILERDKLSFGCDKCFMCENCNHPKAWHDEKYGECHACEDTCNCVGFKPKKKKDKEGGNSSQA